ncbi:L-lactate permease [Paludicola sp. MB14-C6]|uniref:L-lactate permease n=1 Tax=Paludihabitans sp. MB14-C6 TaxID=3070656 RepID=UPI0027DCAAC6|nr:L-lactate permease [Paludicola sp. MB14-C6]WMJ24018.1 L-lactate permease [Paludicola sp. MB14-C6]
MGQIISLIMTLVPIVVIVLLLVVWKKPADITGTIGLLLVALVAIFFFNTSIEVVFRSTVAGLIKSFSVSLIVATSLLQMALMEKSGALKRVIIFIKTIASENKAVQIMMINIGFGTLMVAVGATPVSILPPILLAMGYTTYVAIALPSIGYDSLCTYALLGAPIVVFVDMVNNFLKTSGLLTAGAEITLSQVGHVFAYFLPLTSIMIGIAMLWITGKAEGVKKGILPCLVTGAVIGVISFFTSKFDNLVVLTGVLCGIGVILAMLIYLKVTGKKIIDKSILTEEELAYEKEYPLIKALAPWLLLIGIILILNIPQPVFDLLYRKLLFPIKGLTADGSPIYTRFLWNAYTWILVSTIISIFILRPKKEQLKDTFQTWIKRAPKPVYSAAIFFAIGEVMNMSGFDIATMSFQVDSMIKVLAEYSASAFQNIYGAVAAFIGMFGGFITGSEASTVAMFAKYAMSTAQTLNMNKVELIIVAAGLAFGGGLASVISPAKLQNAAASIDKLGEENKVIRIAFLFSFIFIVITAAFIMLLLKILPHIYSI